MTVSEWESFNAVVHDVLRHLKAEVERSEPGVLVLKGGLHLGLLNLAQHCHANPRREWQDIIQHHLEVMRETVDADVGYRRESMRIRLVPDDYAPSELRESHVAQPYAESVIALLALDLPTAVRPVDREELVDDGIDVADAWALAWGQTREHERPTNVDQIEVNGAKVHSIFGESFFVASLVEFLPELIGEIGENGALVSIPRRHTIVAHVIHDLAVVPAIQTMLPITRKLHAEGPGSVSAHLYWWRAGSLSPLPSSLREGEFEFFPPPDFVELLQSLPQGDEPT